MCIVYSTSTRKRTRFCSTLASSEARAGTCRRCWPAKSHLRHWQLHPSWRGFQNVKSLTGSRQNAEEFDPLLHRCLYRSTGADSERRTPSPRRAENRCRQNSWIKRSLLTTQPRKSPWGGSILDYVCHCAPCHSKGFYLPGPRGREISPWVSAATGRNRGQSM